MVEPMPADGRAGEVPRPGRIELDVLGPLRVRCDGTPLRPGPSQRRTLLAVLLCQVNQCVPTNRLVDTVWGDDPPRTANKNVQVHVYHLRRLLGGPNRIAYSFSGYTLHATPEEIDAARFERLLAAGEDALARGNPERAEQSLTAALGLWRGPAFADLASAGVVAREALRLNELRIVAQEVRNEARLRAGRHQAIIPELQGMLAEHPYREGLASQLMIALYRDGRQTEALDVYHRIRQALADGLGVDPGERLAALYTSILRGGDLGGVPAAAEAVDGHALSASPPRPQATLGNGSAGRGFVDAPYGESQRETLDWFIAAADTADRTLSVARLERLTVADPQLAPPPELYRPADARLWFDREHDNLLAALRSALDTGWASHAWRLAHGLYSMFRLHGEGAPWLSAYEAAVDAAVAAHADAAIGPLRVGLAVAYAHTGSLDQATGELLLALSAARLQGNRRCQLAAICHLGRLAVADGRLDEAERHLREAERLADAEPTAGPESRLWLVRLRGELNLERGRYDRAVDDLEQALAMSLALGDGHTTIMVLCALSQARLGRGDRSGGAAFARQAIVVASTCRDLPAEQASRRQLDRCRAPVEPAGIILG
jgi:DNA-binding SARP family transcriptional activator